MIIDNNWIKLQEGLYLEEKEQTIGGVAKTFRTLHSSDGYCFYDAEEEILDEDGNLIPKEEVLLEQRQYHQQAMLAIQMSEWTHEQLNAKWISIKISDLGENISF